jgi:hypothetical protein
MPFDIAIVGAGAAGLTAGIFAAQKMGPGRVAVLDGTRQPGAKILVAGGGRCNVTNARVTHADFNGGSRHTIRNVLAAFDVARTIAWFADMGVSLHEEEHGKLFPDSNQARTVLNALLARLKRNGAALLAEHRVTQIERENDGFLIATSNGPVRARRVVLATGGESLPKTGSDGFGYELVRHLGHSIVPTTPGLVPFVLDGDFHAELSGIAQDVELVIRSAPAKPVRISGALLWTHFGISGPAVLDASRHWLRARLEGRSATMTANLLPGDDVNSAERKWLDLAAAQPRTILRNALAGWLPARVADAVLRALQIDGRVPLAHLAKDVRRRLLNALLAWPLPVRDSRGHNHAEVTAGGVPLDEIDPATMASRRCPGLHLVGEILDVDGRIGGFNFQWAWASGYVAGHGVARSD